MKKFIIVFVLITILSLSLSSTGRADLILNPTDDTYVDFNEPTNNFNAASLVVDYSNEDTNPCVTTRKSYLRFNLSSLPGDIGPTTKIRVFINFPSQSSATLALWSTGHDWNGADADIGGETTLVWNNTPAPIAQLDTKPSGTTSAWVEFTGANLSNYINAQRSAGNPASFMIVWSTCALSFDLLAMEDTENTNQSGNEPELYPYSPTAITLSAFSASSHITSPWMLLLGVGLLVIIVIAAVILRKRSKAAV